MTTVRFRPEVVDDLAAASDWYEQKRSGLGDDFLTAVERCTERVAATPSLFATVHRNVRRALLVRFPYAVFFVVDESVVTILAVLHVRRDPDLWRRRT